MFVMTINRHILYSLSFLILLLLCAEYPRRYLFDRFFCPSLQKQSELSFRALLVRPYAPTIGDLALSQIKKINSRLDILLEEEKELSHRQDESMRLVCINNEIQELKAQQERILSCYEREVLLERRLLLLYSSAIGLGYIVLGYYLFPGISLVIGAVGAGVVSLIVGLLIINFGPP